MISKMLKKYLVASSIFSLALSVSLCATKKKGGGRYPKAVVVDYASLGRTSTCGELPMLSLGKVRKNYFHCLGREEHCNNGLNKIYCCCAASTILGCCVCGPKIGAIIGCVSSVPWCYRVGNEVGAKYPQVMKKLYQDMQ